MYIRILYVEQEIVGDETTPLENVLRADQERDWLLSEQKRLEERDQRRARRERRRERKLEKFRQARKRGEEVDSEEENAVWDEPIESDDEETSYDLRDIYERLNEIEAHKAEPRACAILVGLGFNREDIFNRPTREFSGGWRMRIALARALFLVPDVLILDEPTNHLDLNAVIWLENYLQNWKKTLLIASHERNFLSSIVNNIIHFHNNTLTTYKGDLFTFLKVRESNQRGQARKEDALKRQVKHQKEIVQKKGKAGAQAKQKIKTLESKKVKMDTDDPTISFYFPDPEQLVTEHVAVIRVVDASFGYSPDKPLFRSLNFGLDLQSRIAIVGPNGVGKSTLMLLMAGILKETNGYIERHRNLRVARFSQHHVDQLIMDVSPLSYLRSKFPDSQELEVRKHLGKMGLPGNHAVQSIATLSGGQKSRVALAELVWSRPHLLMLDEPTNHLDIEMVESLATALEEFTGGLMVVSHNQRLIELICNELWVVRSDGSVIQFKGTFEDYKQMVMSEIEETLASMLQN
eukprot:TRINITY_DN1386_c2_g1_i5.p1 TRINITY_DN1386_c2_g1~~TRINITY_DN1386_c2_g1_i5.p1  ORF type:complete len:521 (-),score=258.43 TRINITY_DN1386_c2_g1_i5:56-1618(-)